MSFEHPFRNYLGYYYPFTLVGQCKIIRGRSYCALEGGKYN